MRDRQLVLVIPLFLVWLFFSGDISAASLAAGVLLSLATVQLFSYMGMQKPHDMATGRSLTIIKMLRRLFYFLCFLPIFGWKVLRSGFYIASLALRPSIDFWPGIVRLPYP